MSLFSRLKCDNDLKEIIKSAVNADLDISGSWGYTQDEATIIHSYEISLIQFQHMFASMRAYIEMNMTLQKEERYGSINLKEKHRTQVFVNDLLYDMVTYEISAIKEDIYASFIKQYKEGYGTKDFDITGHFKQRKDATLLRTEVHWFDISQIHN